MAYWKVIWNESYVFFMLLLGKKLRIIFQFENKQKEMAVSFIIFGDRLQNNSTVFEKKEININLRKSELNISGSPWIQQWINLVLYSGGNFRWQRADFAYEGKLEQIHHERANEPQFIWDSKYLFKNYS